MASRFKGHGQRVAPGPSVPSADGGTIRAAYPGEPAGSIAPYYGGGYPTSAAGYAAAGAAPIRAQRSSWGHGPLDRGSAQEYPVDFRAPTVTKGTPATTARTRRVGSSHPCPGRVPGL